jgi:hypothetical protein
VIRHACAALAIALAMWSCAHVPQVPAGGPDLSALAPDFARLAAAATSADWDETYRLLRTAHRKSFGSKRAYLQMQTESAYRLLELGPPSMTRMGADSWWLIESCGLYSHKTIHVRLMSDTEAVWEEGHWAFTGPGIRTPLDGPPIPCEPVGHAEP